MITAQATCDLYLSFMLPDEEQGRVPLSLWMRAARGLADSSVGSRGREGVRGASQWVNGGRRGRAHWLLTGAETHVFRTTACLDGLIFLGKPAGVRLVADVVAGVADVLQCT